MKKQIITEEEFLSLKPGNLVFGQEQYMIVHDTPIKDHLVDGDLCRYDFPVYVLKANAIVNAVIFKKKKGSTHINKCNFGNYINVSIPGYNAEGSFKPRTQKLWLIT